MQHKAREHDGLPPLREVIDAFDLRAKKSLGQNFLLDLNVTRKIARLANARAGVPFVEIGPGPGGLTRALLMEGVTQLLVIERDKRVLPILTQIQDLYTNQLSILMEDATSFDWQGYAPRPYEIVANLPYNIGTQLLTTWLEMAAPLPFSALTLMFQEEVAMRIVAPEGSKTYGRLSVLANWLCDTEIVYRLPRDAFTPPPKISSAVVRLCPKPTLEFAPCPQTMRGVTAAAFGQRRKMLRASLKGMHPDIINILETVDIDPTARAETLSWRDYCRIALLLEERKKL